MQSFKRIILLMTFVLMVSVGAFAQQQTRTGKVVDPNGETVIGASIVLKGTTVGTVTDENGTFTINAANGQTLVISFIGYATLEQKIDDRTEYEIVMKDDADYLEETIVIGYGTVKKADLAGSVSAVDNKQFKDQHVISAAQALQGRVSGVYTENSSVPGASSKVRVRGFNSVNKSNEPLYVVDGIVRESGIDGINPDDIKSMQILKDASSTAIYGSRGANGVVLVQTKTGSSGQMEIMADATVGVSTIARKIKTLGTKEYAELLVKMGNPSGPLAPYLSGENPGIDWQDQIYQLGITQDYKLAFGGGSEKIQFRVSGNYLDQKGIVVGTKNNRYQAKANIHAKAAKWLDITADFTATRIKTSGLDFKTGAASPIFVALNYSPSMEMFTSDGKYARDPYGSIENNPYGDLVDTQNDRVTNMLNGMFEAKFHICKGLTFTTTNGIDYNDRKEYYFASTKVYTTSSMYNSDKDRMMLQSSNNLTYTGDWGKHHLTLTGVWEATMQETKYLKINGNNLLSESVGYWNYNVCGTRAGDNWYEKWSLLSGLGRLMYDYGGRYLLTATFRADGSSKFSNNKWGFFPSVALAWNLSNERFMRNFTALQDIKIRASYGVVGNQAIDPYSTLGLMGKESYNYGTDTDYIGYWANSVATPDLTWENTNQFDVGLDFSAYNHMFDISIDYFYKKTTDALLQYQAPNYLGGSKYWVNQGQISNRGVDVSFSATPVSNQEFYFNTTLTGTYLKNRVDKLAGGENDFFYGSTPVSGMCPEPATIIKPGEAIGSFYGYKWAGLNEQGQDTYYKADGTVTTTPSGEDKVILGKATPDFTLGWNNRFSYKNLEVTAFFNAAFGVQRLNLTRYAMASITGNTRSITLKEAVDKAGTLYPAIGVSGNNYQPVCSKWVEDASYFRLDNLSIAYTFPKEQTKFADLRLSVSGQNLFVITKYKGYDPSVSNAESDNDAGIDVGAYPNPRIFTFGIRFNF